MDLDLSAPSADEEATPAAEEGAANQAEGGKPAETAAVAPTEDAPEPEDKRARRAAESERDTLKAELDALKGEVAKLKPYGQLEEVAKKDPAQWIAEMAEAQGVTPQRVLEILTKRGAGEEAKLSPDERIAKLEAALAERDAREEQRRQDAEKRESERVASETRRSNVSATADFLKSIAKEVPSLDEKDAESVFDVVEARYAKLGNKAPKDQAGLRALYLDAAKRVDAAVRADVERRAPRLSYSKPTTVDAPAGAKPFKGLSLDASTAPAPAYDPDKAHSEEEIEAIFQRFMS